MFMHGPTLGETLICSKANNKNDDSFLVNLIWQNCTENNDSIDLVDKSAERKQEPLQQMTKKSTFKLRYLDEQSNYFVKQTGHILFWGCQDKQAIIVRCDYLLTIHLRVKILLDPVQPLNFTNEKTKEKRKD